MADDKTEPMTDEPVDGGLDGAPVSDDEKQSFKDALREKAEAMAGPSPEAEAAAAAAGGETPAAEPEQLEPLEHWKLEHQETFRGLDRKAQEFLIEQSKDMEAAHTRRSQEIAPVRQALAHWAPVIQSFGGDPVRTFHEAMEAAYTLRSGTNEQKLALLDRLAREFGVNAEPQQPQYDRRNDPIGMRRQIQEAIAPIQRENAELRQRMQAREQIQSQQAQQQFLKRIQSFVEEKDANGKKLHPYFEEVEPQIGALLKIAYEEGRPMPELGELYETACRMNPAVHAKIAAAEKAKAGRTGRANTARKRAAAQGLSGSATGTDTSKSEKAKLSWREHFKRNAEELAGSAA